MSEDFAVNTETPVGEWLAACSRRIAQMVEEDPNTTGFEFNTTMLVGMETLELTWQLSIVKAVEGPKVN